MNTFREAIQMVINTNQKLLDGTIDVKVANQIAINTQTIINGAKVMIDIAKVAKIDVSEFFSQVKSLEPIEKSLKDIKERQSYPYDLSGKNKDKIEKLIENAHK